MHLVKSLKGAIDAERHVAARFVFEIVAGEAAGERDLHRMKVCLQEQAAAASILFLIAERAAFDAERDFGLDAGEQLHDQGLGAELIAEKCGTVACLAVEGGGEIRAAAEQSSPIVVAPEGADRAETPARLVKKSLAESVARAQIAACGVVTRLEPVKISA